MLHIGRIETQLLTIRCVFICCPKRTFHRSWLSDREKTFNDLLVFLLFVHRSPTFCCLFLRLWCIHLRIHLFVALPVLTVVFPAKVGDDQAKWFIVSSFANKRSLLPFDRIISQPQAGIPTDIAESVASIAIIGQSLLTTHVGPAEGAPVPFTQSTDR